MMGLLRQGGANEPNPVSPVFSFAPRPLPCYKLTCSEAGLRIAGQF